MSVKKLVSALVPIIFFFTMSCATVATSKMQNPFEPEPELEVKPTYSFYIASPESEDVLVVIKVFDKQSLKAFILEPCDPVTAWKGADVDTLNRLSCVQLVDLEEELYEVEFHYRDRVSRHVIISVTPDGLVIFHGNNMEELTFLDWPEGRPIVLYLEPRVKGEKIICGGGDKCRDVTVAADTLNVKTFVLPLRSMLA